MNARFPHLYQEVATRLSEAIRAGSLKAGDRLPSVRQLSLQHQVSIATAMQAYRWLENQRLIEARPKSGYFVMARKMQLAEPAISSPPSAPAFVGVNRLVMEYLACSELPGVAPLGCATPGEALYPGEKLTRLITTIGRRHPELSARYAMSFGHSTLKAAIARRAVEFGCSLTPTDIVITNGCTEALNLALRAVAGPGDTIALESPTYFTLLQIIESLGMKALEIPTHPREGISLEALELATRVPGSVKAVMLVPNFSNPLGSLMPDTKKEALVRLLEQRGIPLIEDDIYGDAYFGSARPFVAKAWDRGGNVLLCSSFTKSLAPSFRVGWIAPGKFRERVEMLKFITSVATPELPQLAIAQFMVDGGYDHHLRKLRAAFARQVQRTAEAVVEYFPPGCRLTAPAGGFVLWVELPPKVDAVALFRAARDQHIALAPGPLFSSTGRYDNFIRLNCGHVWSTRLELALARVGEWVERLAEDVPDDARARTALSV
ncbi:MAG: PLP-dependent aminotransferase family protein [Burkholderiales bacterium]|nr:PLP-dependent aminotransferase family protein [Burkholderiales bacterium]